MPVLSSLGVRTELFKLFYDKNEFVIYSNADAHIAFEHILGLIHGWISSPRNDNQTRHDIIVLENREC